MDNATDILTIICKRAALGDNDARTVLYNRFSQKMFNICIRMAGNRQDAEDLLQEAFVQAFRRLGQVRQAGLFEPWLRKIVVHACIKHAKRAFRWEEMKEGMPPIPEESQPWWETIPFERVHEEIKALPGGCREIFNLYALENYSHPQVAELLNISVSTSKSQYHRARQLLRERLQKKTKQNGCV